MKFAHAGRFAAIGLLAIATVACNEDITTQPEPGATTETAGDLETVVKERQANYKAISDSFKAIRSQAESGNPDYAAIADEADKINQRAQQITDYFPEGTSTLDGYDTEALPAIWQNKAEFDSKAKALVEASAELSGLAVTGDAASVNEGIKKLGSTCKACHDQFRVKQD